MKKVEKEEEKEQIDSEEVENRRILIEKRSARQKREPFEVPEIYNYDFAKGENGQRPWMNRFD